MPKDSMCVYGGNNNKENNFCNLFFSGNNLIDTYLMEFITKQIQKWGKLHQHKKVYYKKLYILWKYT